jgi:hypothetical protein
VTGQPKYRRDPKPWRNELPPEPLPESHPDKWQWRPGEVALGPEPQRPDSWLTAASEAPASREVAS